MQMFFVMFFAVIYLAVFHVLLFLMLWSFYAVIKAKPSPVPIQVCNAFFIHFVVYFLYDIKIKFLINY